MFKEAEEEFKQAIYLNPKFTEGYHYLGLLYFQQEDYDKAVEQWNKILKIEPDFPNKYIVLNNLGIVYNKKEMPDKALEYFVQALQLVPEGDPIEKEIEEEINKIYKSNLKN
jgi:tetratricopeptide (TPR) repeat protein